MKGEEFPLGSVNTLLKVAEGEIPWGRGLPSGWFRAVSFPERVRKTENEQEVQGEARFGPCRFTALLPGGWYAARIHGPWECSGEDSGP